MSNCGSAAKALARGRAPTAPAIATAAILLAGAAACLALNLPGHLSDDSVVQLAQGRRGIYNLWHPPVMAWMLGIADAAHPGAALFVVFDAALIAAALIALALAGRRTSWAAPLVALAVAASPQILIYPAIVWKDVLFAAAALAGFACLAQAAARWRARNQRLGLLAAAAPLLALAALARQNGAVALVFGAAAVGAIAARAESERDGGGARRGAIYALVFLAAGTAIVAAASAALDARGDGEPAALYQWEGLETYDIAGALALDPALPLAVLAARAPGLEAFLRTRGAAAWSPRRIDPLASLPVLLRGRKANAGVIADQWRSIVLDHPLLYLRVRSRVFEQVFLTPRIEACVPVYLGVDGPRPVMARLGLSPRYDDRDEALEDYADRFLASPVFSHLAWAALALILMIGMLRRRRPADIAVAAMLASALVFAASFFAISIACDYRYLYWLDLAALAAALYAAATWGGDGKAGIALQMYPFRAPRDGGTGEIW